MKKTIIVLTVLLASFSIINAQEFRIGVSGGVDAAHLAISGASGGPFKTKGGLTGGILGEARFSSAFGLQLEVNYSSQGTGSIAADGANAGSIQLDYLTIPVLAKLYGTPRFSVYAGPQIGLLLKAESQSSNNEDTDLKDQLEETNFYAVFGSEYRFTNGIFISGRYHFGFTDLIKSDANGTLKNRYFSFRIGYSVKL